MSLQKQWTRGDVDCAAWSVAEDKRAIQLLEGGVSYADIGRVLFIDGLSPVLRTRHGVRAHLRDNGYELPERRKGQHKRKTNRNLKSSRKGR